jgi:alpha-glucosidase
MSHDTGTTADDRFGPRMSRRSFVGAVAAAAGVASVAAPVAAGRTQPITEGSDAATRTLSSPDGSIEVSFDVSTGTPTYEVTYDGTVVVEPSELGMELSGGASLTDNFTVTGSATDSVDRTWQPVWGARSEVTERYEELAVTLEQTSTGPYLTIVFRAFDDGVGFRYVLPEQSTDGANPAFTDFTITAETTDFAFGGDYESWWIPNDYDAYEYLYENTPLSEIQTTADGLPDRGTNDPGVSTPVTMRAGRSGTTDVYLSVHEANLTDYAGMALEPTGATTFQSHLTPKSTTDSDKVTGSTPHPSPWRTIQIGDSPGALVESPLIENLCDPLADVFDPANEGTDWLEPGKYCGVWWSHFQGVTTWPPGPNVGATTERTLEYAEFAAETDLDYVFAEGWNVGWGQGGGAAMDFDATIEKFDLQTVLDYCADNGLRFMAHNETFADVPNYETQIENGLYGTYRSQGITAMKTGYVGWPIVNPDGWHHHGQNMVNHYEYVTEKAAQNRIQFTAHEPVKPTGRRRTYPNYMTREGVHGMEQDGADREGNPPGHTVTIPFTRGLAGPTDFNTGIFQILFDPTGDDDNRVHSTRAHQLANYVTFLSGLQMAPDLIENYRERGGDPLPSFQFVTDVPVDWDETRVIDAAIGEYLTFARRAGTEWYVGSAAGPDPVVVSTPLTFLESGVEYVAEVYSDAESCDYETNPCPVAIERVVVTAGDVIEGALETAGGQAIRLVPLSDYDGDRPADYDRPDLSYANVAAPDTVSAGSPFVVSVDVTNDGNLVAGQSVSVFADGTEVATSQVRVAAGSTRTEHVRLSLPSAGSYDVTVAPAEVGAPSTVTVTVTDSN